MSNIQESPRRALDLCLAIYRITAYFPAGEVLVGQMRELGNEITVDLQAMAELSSVDAQLSRAGDVGKVGRNIERLRMYFQIAKAQNWVKPINWSILDFEYYKLSQGAVLARRGFTRIEGDTDSRGEKENEGDIMSHNIKEAEKKGRPRKNENNGNLLERQKKLFKTIQDNGPIKMSGLIPLLRGMASERTIRNDLRELIGRNLIRKGGINKSAKYSVI